MSAIVTIKIISKVSGFLVLLLLPGFYAWSPTSLSVKIQSLFILAILAAYMSFPTERQYISSAAKDLAVDHPTAVILSTLLVIITFKYLQRKLRYSRLNAIKRRYGYNSNPFTWSEMSIPIAKEIERNIAEYEFPRLFQFAWISDFIRTSTDPGVSRATVGSGHIVNGDEFIEHERLQVTIHLMTAFMAHEMKSPIQSLVLARINEHHHRYGAKINSDDMLYLMIHFGFAPVAWINRFGYRQLEDFEIHALWVIWREIACRMGVKYIPKTVEQAQLWRTNFEKSCRWREDANEMMATAMINQIIYPVPRTYHNFMRKLVVSILDEDIVQLCKLERHGPSSLFRSVAFGIFSLCGWCVREFCWPRLSPYERSPSGLNKKTGLMNFGHTPYDTLPFYIAPTFWNRYGYGSLYRRLRGLPLVSSRYSSNGIKIEAMGVTHYSPQVQAATENKVRENAAILEKAPYGYRPYVGFQAVRLINPVFGEQYGETKNSFGIYTVVAPKSVERFEKRFEKRATSDEGISSESSVTLALEPGDKQKGAKKPHILPPVMI